MTIRALLNLASDRLTTLPLLILYLTDGCNSRCATCDIWRNPRRNMPLALARSLADAVDEMGVRWVLLSGGEAMQHPEWPAIAEMFRERGVRVLLLTNGLLVRRQAELVAQVVDELYVSLDAATPELYAAIRGVDAYDLVLEGIQQASAAGVPVTTRTTVQRRNYRQMPQIADAALRAGARAVSYLAVDTASQIAFGARPDDPSGDALSAQDCAALADLLDAFEVSHAAQFAAGQIAESPAKLRRTLLHYFRRDAAYTPPRCNAPRLSVVVECDGTIRPCYFLPSVGRLTPNGEPLGRVVNGQAAQALRAAVRQKQRPECERCVCPLYMSARALVRM
ncbi:radical SAM protein [Aggregatilineales bacterium SYSU G02658]